MFEEKSLYVIQWHVCYNVHCVMNFDQNVHLNIIIKLANLNIIN